MQRDRPQETAEQVKLGALLIKAKERERDNKI
jgi:hypothetical protein